MAGLGRCEQTPIHSRLCSTFSSHSTNANFDGTRGRPETEACPRWTLSWGEPDDSTSGLHVYASLQNHTAGLMPPSSSIICRLIRQRLDDAPLYPATRKTGTPRQQAPASRHLPVANPSARTAVKHTSIRPLAIPFGHDGTGAAPPLWLRRRQQYQSRHTAQYN